LRRLAPAAAEMDGQIDEKVKEERNQRLLAVVDRLAKEKNAAIVGTVQKVLCEGPSKHNPSTLTGRTPQNKIVIFEGDVDKLTGEILDIAVKESTGFTTYGDVI
jgi:tRNA-2-methylthio-N6-dimethylallyladenosine synthase